MTASSRLATPKDSHVIISRSSLNSTPLLHLVKPSI